MQYDLNTFVDFLTDLPPPDLCEPLPAGDLAQSLSDELVQRNVSVLGVEGTETAFYLRCECEGRPFELMLSADYTGASSRWWIKSYSKQAWYRWQNRRRTTDAQRTLLLALDGSLRTLQSIRSLRWFREIDVPWYLDYQVAAESPIRAPDLDQRDPFLIRLDRRCDWIFVSLVSPLGFAGAAVMIGLMATLDPRLSGVFIIGVLLLLVLTAVVIPAMISRLVAYRARSKRSND